MNSKQSKAETIVLLDRAISFLYSNSPLGVLALPNSMFTDIERKLWPRIVAKLEKEELIYTVSSQVANTKEVRAFISMDGAYLMERCPSFYKNRPFAWKRRKELTIVYWRTIKTIAILVNALAVLALTFLTYYSGLSDKQKAMFPSTFTARSNGDSGASKKVDTVNTK